MQCGEGIIGNFGLGSRHSGQKGRFSGIGQADKAGIGNQLQPQPDPAFLPILSGIGMAWRAVGRGCEIGVAKPAIAAFGQTVALSDLGHIGNQCLSVLIKHLCAARHLEHDIGTIRACAVFPHAMHTRTGLEMLLIAVIDQRVEAINAFDPDIAAASAVSTIGAAEFDKLLTAERDATCATIAGTDIDFGFIEKFHDGSFSKGPNALRQSFQCSKVNKVEK